MQVYPAIDIKGGRVARLDQNASGSPAVRLRNPLEQAELFVAEGATWLHVVDLDRALETGRNNHAWIRRICGLAGVRVQVGGNVCSPGWASEAIEAGAARVVIGTAAALDSTLDRLLRVVGVHRAAVNIDVRRGRVFSRQGVAAKWATADALVRRARDHGIETVVYRDLERDGLAVGADLEGAARLTAAGVSVIAAGGVAALSELIEAARQGLHGVIVGRALYEGRFTVREANGCWQS